MQSARRRKGVSLEGLPETVVEYRLPGKKRDLFPGHERHIIGQEVTKELVVVPAQFSVTTCAVFTPAATARITEMVAPLWSVYRNQTGLSRQYCFSSAVAHVIEEKYVGCSPTARRNSERRGVKVSRQNMANWIMAAQHWLQPIYDRMKQVLLSQDIIPPMKPLSGSPGGWQRSWNPSHTCGCIVQTLWA